MLVTMDGNDSLKCILWQEPVSEDGDGNGPYPLGVLKEQLDEREVEGDYYITQEHVDHWAKAAMQILLPSQLQDNDEDDNPCAGHWTNMVNEVTSCMWGIFDETEIFLVLCRHGFILVVIDMIQSNELYVFLLICYSQSIS